MTTVRVNQKGASRAASGHPWIFRSDVTDSAGASAGETVHVAGPRGRLVGTAHYSTTSQIALRLLDTRAVSFDRDFLRGRITAAAAFRDRHVRDTSAYRLLYSEADLLPGLIADRYGDSISVQFLNQGMDAAAGMIADVIEELFHPQAIVARNDAAVRAQEALPREKKVLRGSLPERVTVSMNGLIWRCDLLEGQKTGIFLDQRENYVAAAEVARGDALDCFTSTGGFALHMARRCVRVEAVDSSAAALETARANREANGIGNVEFREADVFNLLAGYAAGQRRFDTIVLDPPAFAKSRGAVEGALRGYREINRRAIEILRPGGVLITNSCSHHVHEAMLLEAIAQASLDAGRMVRVLSRRTQAADHPIVLTIPETHYLKCLILEVA